MQWIQQDDWRLHLPTLLKTKNFAHIQTLPVPELDNQFSVRTNMCGESPAHVDWNISQCHNNGNTDPIEFIDLIGGVETRSGKGEGWVLISFPVANATFAFHLSGCRGNTESTILNWLWHVNWFVSMVCLPISCDHKIQQIKPSTWRQRLV